MSFLEKAFELSVVIQAIDNFSGPMKKAQESMAYSQKSINELNKAMKLMGSSKKEIETVNESLKQLGQRKEIEKLVKDLRSAGQSEEFINKVVQGFDKLAEQEKKIGKLTAAYEKFKKVALTGVAITAVGVGIDKGLLNMAKSAGDLQMKQVELGGVYGLDQTSEKLKEIDQLAQDLSQKTLFSKSDIYDINLELAHAGISLEKLKNIVPEATYLGEIEVGMGKSPSASATAYNFARMVDDAGISDDIKRMQQFADQMYRVISVTHATSESIGEAFKYSMPVVKNLGWNEQDNLLATAMEARAGVEGSMAGTHIKDFAERINPFKYLGTKGGQKQLEAMVDAGLISGIHYATKTRTKTVGKGKNKHQITEVIPTNEIVSFDEAALIKDKDHIKSYADIVKILSEKHDAFIKKGSSVDYASQLSKDELDAIQERAKLMTGHELSGGELQWAALWNKIAGEQGQDFAIISSHKENFDRLQKQMEIQKSLHQQIDIIRSTFKGQSHILGGNLETIGLQLGKPIMEALVPALVKANELLGKFMIFLNDHPKATKFFGLLAGSVLTFGGALISVAGIVGMLGKSLQMLGVKKGFSLLTRFGGRGAKIARSLGTGLRKGTVAGVRAVPKVARATGLVVKGMGMGLAAPFAAAGKGVMAAGKLISRAALQGISKLPGLLSRAGSAFLKFGAQAMQAGGRVLLFLGRLGLGMTKILIQASAWAVRMAAQWLIAMGPIGWIIMGVIAIVALLVAAWKRDWGHIREHTHNVVEWIKQKFQDMVEWFKSLPGKMKEIGTNIVHGIWEGIKSLSGWLKSNVLGWIKEVVPAPIAKALGIHSPSRVMMEHGRFIAQGLAVGMMDQTRMVRNASLTLAGQVTSGFNGNQSVSLAGGFTPANVTIHIHAQRHHDEEAIADLVIKKLGKVSRGMVMNTGMRVNIGSVY
ncbi:hypothetical protein DNHGIG_25900 [Collibacillus ludicampi]|uniref:Phage tail tape measure protein domain-containing protein n=1 Tax=Collibacillus ludicampi TaxID=2771369 RepID=A0AAV4LGS8_9BACL|nr:phage tail tape measure protein [Collibacillus ludicampi]GIM47041.1 hypothetical protein DNHGIG_25900 [Collibacillus ludicampi]